MWGAQGSCRWCWTKTEGRKLHCQDDISEYMEESLGLREQPTTMVLEVLDNVRRLRIAIQEYLCSLVLIDGNCRAQFEKV